MGRRIAHAAMLPLHQYFGRDEQCPLAQLQFMYMDRNSPQYIVQQSGKNVKKRDNVTLIWIKSLPPLLLN